MSLIVCKRSYTIIDVSSGFVTLFLHGGVGVDAEGYHMHDSSLADAVAALLKQEGARTVGDFGCGLGFYVRDLRRAGLMVGGFDGNPDTAKLSEGRCQVADLSATLDFGTRWDWILSLEVAEHIPHEFEAAFVGNLHRHNRQGIILSWGNQAGHGHVNLKSMRAASCHIGSHTNGE